MIKKTIKNSKTWVTITYQPERKVDSVTLAGSWNAWAGDKMKEKKNGEFYITKVLPVEHSYEFRYFVDEKEWQNESGLPTILNPHGSENMLLEL